MYTEGALYRIEFYCKVGYAWCECLAIYRGSKWWFVVAEHGGPNGKCETPCASTMLDLSNVFEVEHRVTRISEDDLPLYLGFKYKSKVFSKLLKRGAKEWSRSTTTNPS